MVKEYGMSNVGQVYYAPNRRAQFLNPMPEGPGEYSEATAEVIDQEIKGIINVQYERALEILGGKRGILEESVSVLLEKETIEGDELKRLMGQVTGTQAAPPAAASAV
jgi:cell division protease FtsH